MSEIVTCRTGKDPVVLKEGKSGTRFIIKTSKMEIGKVYVIERGEYNISFEKDKEDKLNMYEMKKTIS